jgi:predicted neuraminidase
LRGRFADTPGFSEGNPILFLDGSQRLWLFYVTMLGERWDTCQVKYMHSLDGGQTWGHPIILQAEWGWMTGCKPLLLGRQAILLPLYHEDGCSFTLFSEDGGRQWIPSNSVRTAKGLIQPSVVPLADGRLRMYLRTYEFPDGTLWQAHSENGGRTWGAPERAPLPNPSARVDALRLASGRLAIAFNDSGFARTPLTLALSEDEGATWAYRLDIEDEVGEYSYPALIQSRDGLLHTAYTYERTHIAHVVCDEEYLIAHSR